jgi:hypothetical protein
MMPIIAIMPVSVEVDKICMRPPLVPSAERQMTQPVTLVPKMAPRIMPIACLSCIMPEFTKPTTIAEVAEED